MYPQRLEKSDEIRVISPSRSLGSVRQEIFDKALEFLSEKGYKITFSQNCREVEYANSAGVRSRVEDLHNAFLDKNVKAILTSIGGFNVNQILEYVDYSIIRENPKIICGYSDITALLNSIYAKTGLVTYHGPHFSTFGFEQNREYTSEYFQQCISNYDEYKINPSYNSGYKVIQQGICEGKIVGGNLCTLNLLQGTEYMPNLQDVILFIEDDNIMGDYFIYEFERNLQSLLQVKDSHIKGIVFGSFADDCKVTVDTITQIVKTKKQLNNIPIIFNADFGHVFPFFTFPIGGFAKIVATNNNAEILIKEH